MHQQQRTGLHRTALWTAVCGLACYAIQAAGLEGAGGTPTPDCPPAAQPVELVDPTVLGSGTPGSVTTAAIQAALDLGGHVTFDVGVSPVTIVLDAELVVRRTPAHSKAPRTPSSPTASSRGTSPPGRTRGGKV
jgi:hypothetical protein